MKFGSHLQKSQIPEWVPHYIDYQSLKQLIKSTRTKAFEDTDPDTADLIHLLDQNLDKINAFYTRKYHALSRQLRALQQSYDQVDPAHTSKNVHQELNFSLLELRDQYRKLHWYSEVNRRGVAKITKKIDKNFPSLACSQQYMRFDAEPNPFASHAALTADMHSISDWLARLEDAPLLSPQDDAPISMDTALAADTDPGQPQDLSSVAKPDLALKSDNAAALGRHVALNTQSLTQDAKNRFVLTLLQRAISRRAFDCVTHLLSQTTQLAADDGDLDKRNCLHRYLITVGRSTSYSSSNTQGPPHAAARTGIGPRTALYTSSQSATTSTRPQSIALSEQKHATTLLSHILLHMLPSHRSALLTRDAYGRLPLHYAAEYGLNSATKILLDYMRTWNLPSHQTAWQSSDAQFWQDSDGHAPVHRSVLSGHYLTTKTILAAETPAKDPTDENISPRKRTEMFSVVLAYAVESNDPLITQLLVFAGVNMNYCISHGETVLHIAAHHGRTECLRALLTGSSLHVPDLDAPDETFGFTPIFHACVEGHLSAVEMLVTVGARLDLYDMSGWRAIEHAALHGHIAIAETLHRAMSSLSLDSSPDTLEPPFGTPLSPSASLESNLTVPHQCLTHDSMVLVSLGSMNTRNVSPAVTLELDAEHPLQQDTALSLIVSADGATGEPVFVDLPTHDDLSRFPINFTTSDPAYVKLLFDIVPTHSSGPRQLIGRGVGLLSSIAPTIGPQRTVWKGYLSTPILAASTLKVIGSVSFNFLIVKPFKHPTITAPSVSQPSLGKHDPCLLIGHRGYGKNQPDNVRLQLGENTIEAFKTAAELGVPFVEFDVQLTKDLVPVIYHDFLVSETGIDAPVHMLTLEQFLHANAAAEPDRSRVGPQRTRSRSVSVDPLHRDDGIDMDYRMKYTRDFKLSGYKSNARGKVVQAPFTTLEQLLENVPTSIGLNIEMKFPMLSETEDHAMDNFTVELNSFADAVLTQVYKNYRGRQIVFSSFHPDMCIMLSLKQSAFPVMFLNDAGILDVGDVRARSLREAIRFASRWNLLGIVAAVRPLLLCPRLVRVVRRSGLLLFSYGSANNSIEDVEIQVKEGIDGLIVDDMMAIRKGLARLKAAST